MSRARERENIDAAAEIARVRDTEAKSLNLQHCFLDELPEELFSLSKLEELNLSYNSIQDLSALSYLPRLRRLYLFGCSKVKKLFICEEMWLDYSLYSQNSISPKNIFGFKMKVSQLEHITDQNFVNLVSLDLSSNGLVNLPPLSRHSS
ncbi:MAG: leucine-rich repeat domain-containing protein [Spirochaetota bacterium]